MSGEREVQVAWRVVGHDSFSGESYDIAEAPSRDAAEAVARAYLDRLETEQPSAASGGQGDGGIQDRIYILTPDGQRHRYVRPVEG